MGEKSKDSEEKSKDSEEKSKDSEEDEDRGSSGKLCDDAGVEKKHYDDMCENKSDVCEVYFQVGKINGESNVNTGKKYCEAFGMECVDAWDDKNGCEKKKSIGCKSNDGGSSDHIVRCRPGGGSKDSDSKSASKEDSDSKSASKSESK